MIVAIMYADGRVAATACGEKGSFRQASIEVWVCLASAEFGSEERLISIASIRATSVVWNGLTRQKRAGVGPSLSSVGSKTKWNQCCASSYRWLRDRWIATVSGRWKKSSQL